MVHMNEPETGSASLAGEVGEQHRIAAAGAGDDHPFPLRQCAPDPLELHRRSGV
jgi:hypothetical protein